jgi:diacylglycerol O-acyltransferase / wax synthase
MKQLSGLDASFLYLETPEMPMHVGALHLLELPTGYKGRFVRDLRRHIAARLPLTPALRRRLWWMPLKLANPAWVDAAPDLNKHIVEIKLPKGSELKDLEQAVGKLHTVLLDRSRPLWKMHVFEGLAPGPDGRKRVALYTQLHHAAVDGQAAVALASVLLDMTETPRKLDVKPSARPRKYRIGLAEMVSGAVLNQVQQISHLVRTLPSTVGTLSKAAKQAAARSSLVTGKAGSGNLALAPRTALNVTVTDQRAFAAVGVPLEELRAIGRANEATLNDMVLMLCSTALRRYLARHKALPKKSLIAAVPVSLRQAGDTAADNQASITVVSLGTHIADPAKRLAHILRAAAAMKAAMGSVKSVLPTDFPSVGLPWLMETATKLYGRAIQLGRRFHQPRQGQGRRPRAATRERGDLQRARPQRAAVSCGRTHADQLPDLGRRARHGAQHHRAELRPVAGLRVDGRCEGDARRAPARRFDRGGVRRCACARRRGRTGDS